MTRDMEILIALVVLDVIFLIVFFIILAINFKRKPAQTLVLVLGPKNIVTMKIRDMRQLKKLKDPIPPKGYKFNGWSKEPMGYENLNVAFDLPRIKNAQILYATWMNIKDQDELQQLTEDEKECQIIIHEKEGEYAQLLTLIQQEEKNLAAQTLREQEAVTLLQKSIQEEEKARVELAFNIQLLEKNVHNMQFIVQQLKDNDDLILLQDDVELMRRIALEKIAIAKENLAVQKKQINEEKIDLQHIIKELKAQVDLQAQKEKEGITVVEKIKVIDVTGDNTKKAENKGDFSVGE